MTCEAGMTCGLKQVLRVPAGTFTLEKTGPQKGFTYARRTLDASMHKKNRGTFGGCLC